MNVNRIRKAVDHIQVLINHSEAGRLEQHDVKDAREGLDYLKHVLNAAIEVEHGLCNLADAADRVIQLATECGRALDSEPKSPGMSLGI